MAHSMIRVPFTNTDWAVVRDAFRSEDAAVLKDAVSILAAWRARTGKAMPVAADISELILRVLIADAECVGVDDWWSAGNVRLLFCTAIIR
uniref:Uncharacterized protein n=1 Tax=Plectus sambesii TaxID=2011161 RepID=A0A914VSV6_9BILA